MKHHVSIYTWLGVVTTTLVLVGCTSSSSQPTVVARAPTSTPVPAPTIVAHPIVSKGCGKPAPVTLGTTLKESVSTAGINREYLLHVPRNYQHDTPTPLVLNFHGHSSSDREQEQRSGMSRLAEQFGFIAVYPQGLRGADGRTEWATTARRAKLVNEVLFVSDLLNGLQGSLCVDPRRIYATGFSNGGGMTNLLACQLANRIAAFAPVSGSYPPDPYGECQPTRPVPILEIHGTEDVVVPYYGNPAQHLQSIPVWLDEWAIRDGCSGSPHVFYEKLNVTGTEWTNCQDNATVVHYRITGGDHSWPPAIFFQAPGTAAQRVSASELIWTFFQEHPLSIANAEVRPTP